jgi:hypothetical protein
MAHDGNGCPIDHVAEPDAVLVPPRNGKAVACAACGMTSDMKTATNGTRARRISHSFSCPTESGSHNKRQRIMP